MGSCYSRKASGGKYTYSTVQMASTKLEETSRLARPTPYCRNANATGFNSKKGIVPPIQYEQSSLHHNANEQNDGKNYKISNNLPSQSNIPRFSSSVPTTTLNEDSIEKSINVLNTNRNKNETNELHVANNNSISNSRSATNVNDCLSNLDSNQQVKNSSLEYPKSEKVSMSSKSCPDSISTHGKTEDKHSLSRIPAKVNSHTIGLPRPQIPHHAVKSSHAISHMNTENHSASKGHSHSCDKSNSPEKVLRKNKSNQNYSSNDFNAEFEINKLSSYITSDSHDSITDIDSGLGSSLTEKNKQEDADTLKDVDRLESCEESPISHTAVSNVDSLILVETIKEVQNMKIGNKSSIKYPMYKRELNGKWTVDDKNLETAHKFNSQVGCRKEVKQDIHRPVTNLGDKTPYKINVSDNAYSTYAAYKGHTSYKKYSPFKQIELATPIRGKDKLASDKNKIGHFDVSSIPKVKRATIQDNNESSNLFSITKSAEKDKIEKGQHNLKIARKVTYKMDLPSDSNQSSPESEDKSDSIGNGVKSPVSEIENREFLIDDEISDQPGLISFETGKMTDSQVPSLQQSVTELYALQVASSSKKFMDSQSSFNCKFLRDRSGSSHRDSLILGSDLGSSCSSIASDDLMMDYEKTLDNFPEGTVNEGPASPVKKMADLEGVEDQVPPLGFENKSSSDFEDKLRKRLYRRSSGPYVGGSNGSTSTGKSEWRLRSVSLPLRPPRPMSVSEDDDGNIKLDASSYRLLYQDLTGVKTLLLRLKSVIQEAETINPFDQANPKNIFYHSLVRSDFPASSVTFSEEGDEKKEASNPSALAQENADLCRQLVLLQQQLEEKDHTIHLLQQQMTKYTTSHCVDDDVCTVNAATQTERTRSLTGSVANSLSSSVEDSSETLVSVQDAFEEHFSKTVEEQDIVRDQMEEVSRSLSSLNQNLRKTAKKYPHLQNRSVSSSELCYRKNS